MKIRLPFFILALFLTIGINAQTTILDFETEATSTTFQYFGSDLEPNLTNVIANPDPSGINTSAMVSDFMKPVGAQVWAGAFANPVTMPVNVVAGNEVCMKVWFEETGSVSLKLEGGTTPNWLTTQPVNETGTWTQLCWDTNDASLEDPFGPAAGGVFNQVTLFFDFGTTPTADMTYYFDDLIVGEGTADPADVTFAVDMNSYSGTFTNVFVSGNFNDWSGNGNPLSDDDGDGVYTGTVTGLQPGAYEYKFQVDEWTAQEDFSGKNFSCTITDESGVFTNRKLGVGVTETLPTVCWQSCFACGDAVDITVNLGGAAIDVDSSGLFIAGGGNFGNPGDNPLLDEDGDDVYSMVFEKQVGFESFYTFTNGACGDYSCKENIAGQSCANPDNFNDRKMGPVMEDLVINTCFGVCTEDTDCEGGGESLVTFSVDMNSYTEPYTTVYVAGSFAGWSGVANPMTDDDGDGVYTTTISMLPTTIEYKFELDDWAVSEEFNDGDPCTVTDPTGAFVNRVLEVGNSDVEVCFLWSTCTACMPLGVSSIEATDNLFVISPSLVQSYTTIQLNETYRGEKELILFNTLGEIISIEKIGNGIQEYRLSAEDLQNGLYYLNIQTDGVQQTQKFIVNR